MATYKLHHIDPHKPPAAHELPDSHPRKAEPPKPFHTVEIEAATPQEAVEKFHSEYLPNLHASDPRRRHTFVEHIEGPDPAAEAREREQQAAAEKEKLEARIAELERTVAKSRADTAGRKP